MSKQKETNKKLPETAVEKIETDYPYCTVTRDTNGGAIIVYRNPLKPWESFETRVNPDGSYSTKQISKQYKGMNTGMSHESRSYVTGGSSSQVDGNKDKRSESTSNENIVGDKGSGVGGNAMTGAKKNIGGTSEGSFGGEADGKQWKTVNGDYNENVEGSYNISVKGKKVASTVGCDIEMIKGDKGIFVTEGTFALNTKAGYMNFWSKDKILMTSEKEIYARIHNSTSSILMNKDEVTITGPSSSVYIKMTSSGIEIKAPSVKFVKG